VFLDWWNIYKGERPKDYPDKAKYQRTTANTKWKLEGDMEEL
jgi:hypothetical protein